MRMSFSRFFVPGILAALFVSSGPAFLHAKERTQPVDPNDATLRLYQLLDDTREGKLADFYVLADIYKVKDAKDPNQEYQHVLLVEYDKNKGFGKLNIHVRSVGKLDPAQMKAYTLKQIYDFGVDDREKFMKTDPGSFGRTGDIYLRSTSDMPVAQAPVTDEVRKDYETYITQYIIPALQKK